MIKTLDDLELANELRRYADSLESFARYVFDGCPVRIRSGNTLYVDLSAEDAEELKQWFSSKHGEVEAKLYAMFEPDTKPDTEDYRNAGDEGVQ